MRNAPTNLPALDVRMLSATTRITIATRLDGGSEASIDALDALGGLPYVLFELITIALRSGGPIDQATSDLTLAALRESGYIPPAICADSDILAMMDRAMETVGARDAAEANAHARVLLLGAAIALAAGDPYAAQSFLDGPEGAGIGWDLTKQEIQARMS